jgi:glycosyltransferase involved in cell wall biosynthesis
LALEKLPRAVEVVASPLPLPGTLWLATLAARQLASCQVFVGTLGILPRRLTVPSVLVLHDLTPRTRPHHHRLTNRFCFNAYLQESLASARVVVASSQATARRLHALYPGWAAQVQVIPLAVDAFFSPGEENVQEVRQQFAQGRPFILQLGTLEPRKGVTTLLRAHQVLLEQDPEAPDLVLAGGRGWGGNFLERTLAQHPFPQRVHLPGYVTRAQARALLRCAEVVVLASEEEGFGLPLAEGMACGAACVASDEEALVEVAAGAALHAPRGDPQKLAKAIAQALSPKTNRELRKKALLRARELTWEGILPRWVRLLQEVAGQG